MNKYFRIMTVAMIAVLASGYAEEVAEQQPLPKEEQVAVVIDQQELQEEVAPAAE